MDSDIIDGGKMKFYVLDTSMTKLSADTEFTILEPFHTGPAPQCPRCGTYIGMLTWLPPYRVTLETRGEDFGDIVGGPGFEVLVSERFRDLYDQRKLTGIIAFEPVEVVGIKRHKRFSGNPPAYFKADIVFSEATVDDNKSGLTREHGPRCPKCHQAGSGIRKADRIVLEDDTWSGEDLFRPRGDTGDVMTSARFKEFCETHAITNAKLVPALEYSFDFYKHRLK